MCGSFLALGLETKQYLSVQGDEVYLLVRAPEALLAVLAEKDQANTSMECRPEELRLFGLEIEERLPGMQVQKLEIPSQEAMQRHGVDTSDLYGPYEYMYMPYSHLPRYTDLYVHHRRFLGGKKGAGLAPGERRHASASASSSHHHHSHRNHRRPHHHHLNTSSTYFCTTLRLKLLSSLIEGAVSDGGAGVDFQLLADRGWAVFPLHNRQVGGGCVRQKG